MMLDDFFESQKQWEDDYFKEKMKAWSIDLHTYQDLFQPAIEILMETIGNNADEV